MSAVPDATSGAPDTMSGAPDTMSGAPGTIMLVRNALILNEIAEGRTKVKDF